MKCDYGSLQSIKEGQRQSDGYRGKKETIAGSEWLMTELNPSGGFFVDGAVAPLSGEMFNYCHQGYSTCEIVQTKSQIKLILRGIRSHFESKYNTELHQSVLKDQFKKNSHLQLKIILDGVDSTVLMQICN